MLRPQRLEIIRLFYDDFRLFQKKIKFPLQSVLSYYILIKLAIVAVFLSGSKADTINAMR